MEKAFTKQNVKKIVCRNDVYGTMDFFLDNGAELRFLFRTRYFSKDIFREYQGGKAFAAVLEQTPSIKHRKLVHKKRHEDLTAKRFGARKAKLKERIVRTVKYIDREYDLSFSESRTHEVA